MKRAVFKLVVFLLAGAIATFGVSWWCGWRVLFDQRESLSIEYRPAKTPVRGNEAGHVDSASFYCLRVERQTGAAAVSIRALMPDQFSDNDWSVLRDADAFDRLWRQWGPWPSDWGLPRRLSVEPPEEFFRHQPYKTDYSIAARGWPMLATWCELNANDPGGVSLGLGLVPGTFYSADRVLAFRPIWRGIHDRHDLLRGGSLAALRRAVRGSPQAADQARLVPGVRVPDWRERSLYRVRQVRYQGGVFRIMNWLWYGMLPSELELTPDQRFAALQKAAQKTQKSVRAWTLLSLLIPLVSYILVASHAPWMQSTIGQWSPLGQMAIWTLPGMIPPALTTAIQ